MTTNTPAPSRNALGPRANGRKGDWCALYTGTEFYPMDPRPEDVHLEDVAHALASIPRFGGHARWTEVRTATGELVGTYGYSVATHAILTAKIAESIQADRIGMVHPLITLAALHHDSPEALMGFDAPRPFKVQPELAALRDIEHGILGAVGEAFSIPLDLFHHPIIKEADEVALATEARALMPPSSVARWHLRYPPLEGVHIKADPPHKAARLFITLHQMLTHAVVHRLDGRTATG